MSPFVLVPLSFLLQVPKCEKKQQSLEVTAGLRFLRSSLLSIHPSHDAIIFRNLVRPSLADEPVPEPPPLGRSLILSGPRDRLRLRLRRERLLLLRRGLRLWRRDLLRLRRGERFRSRLFDGGVLPRLPRLPVALS